MFGKYFRHILVLTLISGFAYSLPQVKDAMGDAFSFGYYDSAAVVNSITSQPIVIKDINAKVVYDGKHQESAINITAKVQITANNADIYLADNSFYFNLKNKTLNNVSTIGMQSNKIVSDLTLGKGGFYVVKQGTTALFNVTSSVNPSSMISGQYNASLTVVVLNNEKSAVPTNTSNTIIVVGENSPYITLVGQGSYGTKDTIVLNSTRIGKNATITFQQIPQTCPPNFVCTVSALQTFPIKESGNSDQIKFNLSQANLTSGYYQVYVTNTQLGTIAGKSNVLGINILDQSKLITANVNSGKLVLSYDSTQKESALSASFEVRIKAGDNDIQFGQGSFGVMAQNENGNQIYSQANIVYVNKKAPVFPYVLKANTEATFNITASANPKIMFAGNYSMSLYGIYPLTPINSTQIVIQVPSNKTNSVVVIGETSPYISSVNPNPAIIGKVFTINGQRLSGSNILLDGYSLANTMIVGSLDGTSLQFDLSASTTDGYHMISVKNDSTGASNTVWFQSIGGVITTVPSTDTCPVGYVCGSNDKGTNVSCPTGYICSAIGETSTTNTCPEGFTCTNVIDNCPTGYTCSTQTPVIVTQPPVVVVPPTPTTNNCYQFTSNLTVGSTGADVVALQNYLIKKGFTISNVARANEVGTGYFGSQTKAAVYKYQTSLGQPATGFVGPITIASLNSCTSVGVTSTPVSAN